MSMPALAGMLGSANAVKSTQQLSQFITGVNQAQQSGALDNLREVLTLTGNLNTVLAPFKVFLAQLQAGTTESAIKLMTNLFSAMESPAGQATLEAATTFFNTTITNAADIVLFVDAMVRLGQQLPLLVKVFIDVSDAGTAANNELTKFANMVGTTFVNAMADGKISTQEFTELFYGTLVENGYTTMDNLKTYSEQFRTGEITAWEGAWKIIGDMLEKITGLSDTQMSILFLKFELFFVKLHNLLSLEHDAREEEIEAELAAIRAARDAAIAASEALNAISNSFSEEYAEHHLEGQQ